MFNPFKMMGALSGLMGNQAQLEQAVARARSRAEAVRAEGVAGGGAVRVIANGLARVTSVELSPALIASLASGLDSPEAREMSEHLIAEATNEAISAGITHLLRIISEEAEAMGVKGIGPQIEAQVAGFLRADRQ